MTVRLLIGIKLAGRQHLSDIFISMLMAGIFFSFCFQKKKQVSFKEFLN